MISSLEGTMKVNGVNVDRELGRVYLLDGLSRLQVVAVDAEKGVRIWSRDFTTEWVPFAMWRELHTNGLLEETF
jgi:hypothetical protein